MPNRQWWIFIPLALAIAYLVGPHPSTPAFTSTLPVVPNDLQRYVAQKESQKPIRSDNEARIIWANDSAKVPTEYAILYLHGFSASQAEGEPVHRNIAKHFGCNLYLSRLAGHGLISPEPLLGLRADSLWESAKEAYVIASHLGKKVIVMGTSTGGTLALMLAARYPDVHSLILLSPNIRIFDKNAWLVNNPWGLQIARAIVGSDYIYSEDTRPLYKQYWSYGYRIEAVAELQELLEASMHRETFNKVDQPVLMLYYYRDEVHQDSVVRVDEMVKMFEELATPSAQKRAVAMPDAGNHVIGSFIKSADVDGVTEQIRKFMVEVLKIDEPQTVIPGKSHLGRQKEAGVDGGNTTGNAKGRSGF